MKINKENLTRLINNYNGLEKKEQEKIDKHISRAWGDVYEHYMTACEQDAELCNAYDELKKIRKILAFDLSKEFTVYSHTENEFDPEAAEPVYVYSPEKFAKAKEIAENIDKLLADLNKKLEDLNSRKVVLFRETRIAKIEEQIKTYTNIANHYNTCMKKQAEKDYYLANEDALITPYQKLYAKRTAKYAKESIDKHIEIDPVIVCKRHASSISSTAHERDFSTQPLNKACNDVRDNILFDITETQGMEK